MNKRIPLLVVLIISLLLSCSKEDDTPSPMIQENIQIGEGCIPLKEIYPEPSTLRLREYVYENGTLTAIRSFKNIEASALSSIRYLEYEDRKLVSINSYDSLNTKTLQIDFFYDNNDRYIKKEGLKFFEDSIVTLFGFEYEYTDELITRATSLTTNERYIFFYNNAGTRIDSFHQYNPNGVLFKKLNYVFSDKNTTKANLNFPSYFFTMIPYFTNKEVIGIESISYSENGVQTDSTFATVVIDGREYNSQNYPTKLKVPPGPDDFSEVEYINCE